MHTDCRRNIEAARDDRSVRILSTKIGHETTKRAIPELQHIRRRNIMRDHDDVSDGAVGQIGGR